MRVSICIPHFNQHWYLLRAVSSALAQGSADVDLEVLVADNGSDRECEEVLRRCEELDPRVRVLRSGYNIGMVANWNRAVRASCGDIVCLLCADDELMPGAVDLVCSEFARDESIVLVWGPVRRESLGCELDEATKPFGERVVFPAPSFLRYNFSFASVQLAGAFFRRTAYDLVGGFKGEAGTQADWLFWGELGAIGTVVYTPHELGVLRIHGDNETARACRTFEWIAGHYIAELRQLEVWTRAAGNSMPLSLVRRHAPEAAIGNIKRSLLERVPNLMALRQSIVATCIWPSTRTLLFACAAGVLSAMPLSMIKAIRRFYRSLFTPSTGSKRIVGMLPPQRERFILRSKWGERTKQ